MTEVVLSKESQYYNSEVEYPRLLWGILNTWTNREASCTLCKQGICILPVAAVALSAPATGTLNLDAAGSRLVDTRVLERRRKKTKKTLKNVIFDSQVSLVNRSQGLEKKKKEHSKI